MAVEKLLRWLMLISSDADAVEFRISESSTASCPSLTRSPALTT